MKYLILIPLLFCFKAYSQQCPDFPADCPSNIEDAGDSDACIRNFILPQEITMQNKLREKFSALMNDVAGKNNWQVYEFFEEAGNGIKSGEAPLSYQLRRPYQWRASFVFIVNEDSLHAWQNWYNNDLQNKANDVVNSYKQASNNLPTDDGQKKYSDSAVYYGNLKTKYMTDHAADYQKAILSGDKKGEKKYEDESKAYDDKINAFINKANDKTEKDLSSSKGAPGNLEDYKHKNTIAYRNASMIRVSLDVNDNIAIADDEGKKIIKNLSVPATTMTVLLHNNSPDEHEIFGQYLRSPDVAMLLFGKWILKEDEYHSYHAAWSADKKNTDNVSVKKISCDKVQTMIMHVEGSPKYINQFLLLLDTQKLNNLITKE